MGILFDNTSKTFTLHTKCSTYQMKVDDYGFLLHLYYGRYTKGTLEYLLTYADRGFSGNPYDLHNDRTYSMDVLPQEFPCRGIGDFRSPAFAIRNEDGSFNCDLRYRSHTIYNGKYKLSGLPAVYAKEEEAQTLDSNHIRTMFYLNSLIISFHRMTSIKMDQIKCFPNKIQTCRLYLF